MERYQRSDSRRGDVVTLGIFSGGGLTLSWSVGRAGVGTDVVAPAEVERRVQAVPR
jgi:hypothetical protein